MTTENGKSNIENIMLRILSVLAVNVFIYAGIIMLRAFIFHDDGGAASAVLYAVFVCFAHALGSFLISRDILLLKRMGATKFVRFVTFMLNIRESERFISSLAVWGLIVVPAAVTVIVYGRFSIERVIFELIPMATAYIVPLKQSRLSPARIMNSTSIFAGMSIMVICLELPYLVNRLAYLRPLYFIAAYFIIFAFLVIKNQEDIENQIFSKKHIDKSVLPKNLRRFNLTMVCFVFVITLLLFNLKTIVVYILNLARQIIDLVFRAFLWVIENLLTETATGGSVTQGSIIYGYGSRPLPFLNLITNVLKYFVILYLAYKLIFAIVVRIPSFIAKIIGIVKKMFGINNSTEAYAESDFVDLTEIVLPDVRDLPKRAKKKKCKAKSLNQITDPVEKVRHMYGNILGMLPMRGIKPENTDTVREIVVKASENVEVQDSLSPFTEIYEQVRYGEVVPDTDTLARAQTYYDGLLK